LTSASGFFSINQVDFGTTEQRSADRTYITRWRLEKRIGAAMSGSQSDRLHVDPATPEQ
jgi:hypothetical protein